MSTFPIKGQPLKTFEVQRADISVDKSPGKRNLAPENGDSRPSIDDKVEGQTEKTQHTFLDKMDAIARGVEAWFEENTGYSRRVTEMTVATARELGMPEDEILRWAASRLIRDTEKFSVIKSLLERLEARFLADRADDEGYVRKR